MDQKNIIIIVAIIITAAIVSSGVYFWQQSVFEAEKQGLQQQINSLNSQVQALRNQLGGEDEKCIIDESTLLFDPVKYGDSVAYAKSEGGKNYVILCSQGQDVVMDQGDADWNAEKTNINEVKKYDSLKFSPQGTFIFFTASRWEWGSSYVYDIQKNKLVLQNDLFISPLEFTSDDKFAYYCGPQDRSADDGGFVYVTENFDVVHSSNFSGAEFDIHSIYESGKLLVIKCRYYQLDNAVIFDVVEYDGLEIDQASRKYHEYSLDEGKIIDRQ